MAPMEDNAITTVDVLFEHEFDSIPSVVASAVGDTPGDTVIEVRNVTTAGATLAMRTTATDPVRVDWIASCADTPPHIDEPPFVPNDEDEPEDAPTDDTPETESPTEGETADERPEDEIPTDEPAETMPDEPQEQEEEEKP